MKLYVSPYTLSFISYQIQNVYTTREEIDRFIRDYVYATIKLVIQEHEVVDFIIDFFMVGNIIENREARTLN